MAAPQKIQRTIYVPVKDDPVDVMMAKYINEYPIPVPVERLSPGNYMLGLKKV